jgi:hypothetical protein
MIPNVRLHQLYILRSQVDLLISMEEGLVAEQVVECSHPEDKRTALQNFGEAPHFRCLTCGADVPGQA